MLHHRLAEARPWRKRGEGSSMAAAETMCQSCLHAAGELSSDLNAQGTKETFCQMTNFNGDTQSFPSLLLNSSSQGTFSPMGYLERDYFPS